VFLVNFDRSVLIKQFTGVCLNVMEDIEINVGPIYRFKWKYVYIILVCRSIASIPSTFVNS